MLKSDFLKNYEILGVYKILHYKNPDFPVDHDYIDLNDDKRPEQLDRNQWDHTVTEPVLNMSLKELGEIAKEKQTEILTCEDLKGCKVGTLEFGGHYAAEMDDSGNFVRVYKEYADLEEARSPSALIKEIAPGIEDAKFAISTDGEFIVYKEQ